LRELKKLDPQKKQRIVDYLEERIGTGSDPMRFGKALKADLAGLWRYRGLPHHLPDCRPGVDRSGFGRWPPQNDLRVIQGRRAVGLVPA